MDIHPVVLDSRPSYLQGSGPAVSLLLLPVGTGTLLDHVRSRVARVTPYPPLVFAPFEADGPYQDALRQAAPDVRGVLAADELRAQVEAYEPSDWLLVVDPRVLPAAGLEPESLLRHPAADPRWARHLVALESSPDGTWERVEVDGRGRVRRIQRFYDGVTWPFTAGVCCSLLPAASALVAGELPLTSLAQLRQALAAQGVPARDLPVESTALDLTEESGVLAFAERFIREATSGQGRLPANGQVLYAGAGHHVHSSARLIGPVIVHAEATVEEEATVLGPALIGAGARIGRGALVAQSLIAPGAVVPPGAALRHRVLAGERTPKAPPPRAAGMSWPAAAWESSAAAGRNGRLPSAYASLKPLLEGLAAALALLLLSPLLLIIAALIKLDSRGPVLYGHRREGRDGRLFRCWKFRTMHLGAEARERQLYARNQVDGPQFKLDRDPRITPVGRWLRPTSLDEIPQLINVVLGHMSLIGPRPSPFRENQVCVPWREGRLSVRPGITGLWQVCRHDRSAGDFHQWIRYDLLYVRHLSFWLDLKIVLATVLTLGGKGHVPLSWMISAARLQEEA